MIDWVSIKFVFCKKKHVPYSMSTLGKELIDKLTKSSITTTTTRPRVDVLVSAIDTSYFNKSFNPKVLPNHTVFRNICKHKLKSLIVAAEAEEAFIIGRPEAEKEEEEESNFDRELESDSEEEERSDDDDSSSDEEEEEKEDSIERVSLEQLTHHFENRSFDAPPKLQYILNNRKQFVKFIHQLFAKYNTKMKKNNTHGMRAHQKIVKEYINLLTPYRGLLLYHGPNTEKTCTAIALAEGMKSSKKIYVLLPASLKTHFMEELKKCGDQLYKRHQYWVWIDVDATAARTPDRPIKATATATATATSLAAILQLPRAFIVRSKGAWFIDTAKKSNFDSLSSAQQQSLETQINAMIEQKYNILCFDDLTRKTFASTKNPFDGAVVLIEEAHTLVSRINVPLEKTAKSRKDDTYIKLYKLLMSAKDCKIVLLSATPVVNHPNEFGILFNILRGYITTWKVDLSAANADINADNLRRILVTEGSEVDYMHFDSLKKELTFTRTPDYFVNSLTSRNRYAGVVQPDKNRRRSNHSFVNDLKETLLQNGISSTTATQTKYKLLPDTLKQFASQYLTADNELKNIDSLKRRILGLVSYFKGAQKHMFSSDKNQWNAQFAKAMMEASIDCRLHSDQNCMTFPTSSTIDDFAFAYAPESLEPTATVATTTQFKKIKMNDVMYMCDTSKNNECFSVEDYLAALNDEKHQLTLVGRAVKNATDKTYELIPVH